MCIIGLVLQFVFFSLDGAVDIVSMLSKWRPSRWPASPEGTANALLAHVGLPLQKYVVAVPSGVAIVCVPQAAHTHTHIHIHIHMRAVDEKPQECLL